MPKSKRVKNPLPPIPTVVLTRQLASTLMIQSEIRSHQQGLNRFNFSPSRRENPSEISYSLRGSLLYF